MLYRRWLYYLVVTIFVDLINASFLVMNPDSSQANEVVDLTHDSDDSW